MAGETIETVFRDFVTSGIPSSGFHEPRKPEIRNLLNAFLAQQTGANAGALIQTSKTALDGLSPAANTMAWVIGDANPNLDGVYQRSGSSWVKRGPLPYSVIKLNNTGAGTANAIQVTTAFGLPSAAFGAIYILNVTQPNTGAVTISINGGTPKPLVSNTGNPLLSGALSAGMALLCVDDGTNIRLLVPGDIDAIIAAAEAILAAAEALAGAAFIFPTEADFESADIPVSVQFVRVEGYHSPGDGGGHLKVRIAEPDTPAAWEKASSDGAYWTILEDTVNPKMFGARLDDATIDTPAMNDFIGFINSGLAKGVEVPKGVALVGPLAEVTASDVTWLWRGSLKSTADGIGLNEACLKITGDRHTHIGKLEIDGNKAAYTAVSLGHLFFFAGDGHKFDVIKCHRSAGVGLVADQATNFVISGALICEENDGLGYEFRECAFYKVHNTSACRNGFGFGKTRLNPADDSHDFVAFGGAERFRCHDGIWIGGDFSDNGRDGKNINQGCYKIKHIACRADNNDDGGHTMAADDTGSERPGEGESCYDISYFDCDGENNYTAAIIAYQPMHGVVIKGGVQKNNHRLAGSLAEATSYFNGIFIAAGSTGVDIDTMSYDDRQQRTVTAVSGSCSTRVITATSWLAGLKDIYPKVAVYTSSGGFRGYGKITAESAGSVTIETAPFNGVDLSLITAGDIITQAVQHNGVLLDNNVYGAIRVRGNKPRVGPTPSIQGQITNFASTGNEGSELLLDGVESDELLLNPSFDAGITGWSFSTPGGGDALHETGATRKSAGSLKLVGGSSPANGDASLLPDAKLIIDGEKWRLFGFAFSSVAGDASVSVFRNLSPNVVDVWTAKGTGWEPIVLSGGYEGGNELIVRLSAAAGRTVWFDSLSFRPLFEVPMRTPTRRN